MATHGDDPDRAAILARRRRFIALTLGGLATGCAPGKPAPDTTTADSVDPTTASTTDPADSESAGETGSESTTPPPYLQFDIGPASGSSSGPKLDLPPDDTDTSTDTGPKLDLPPDDTGSDSDTDTDTGTSPRPCLVPPGVHSD